VNPNKEALSREFVCPKCHGRGGLAEDVALPTGRLSGMLAVSRGRYIAVSCSLCGYTEFYNLAVVAHAEEPAKVKAKLAREAEQA